MKWDGMFGGLTMMLLDMQCIVIQWRQGIDKLQLAKGPITLAGLYSTEKLTCLGDLWVA